MQETKLSVYRVQLRPGGHAQPGFLSTYLVIDRSRTLRNRRKAVQLRPLLGSCGLYLQSGLCHAEEELPQL